MIDPNHIYAIRDRILADRGWLMLLALSEKETSPGSWDLLIAGGGLSSRLEDYQYVAELMKQELTNSEIFGLNAVVLIRDTNEWLQKLVERVHVGNGHPVEVRDVEFGEVSVRRALIFHAQPAEVAARA
jgi:hypothetical protein